MSKRDILSGDALTAHDGQPALKRSTKGARQRRPRVDRERVLDAFEAMQARRRGRLDDVDFDYGEES